MRADDVCFDSVKYGDFCLSSIQLASYIIQFWWPIAHCNLFFLFPIRSNGFLTAIWPESPACLRRRFVVVN